MEQNLKTRLVFSSCYSGSVKLFRILILFVFTGLMALDGTAQQFTNNQPAGGGNFFPFGATGVGRKVQQHYFAGEIVGAYPGLITNIYFRRSGATGASSYTGFKVSLATTSQSSFTGSPSPYFTAGITQVFAPANFTIPAGANASWFAIPLSTPFFYDPTKTLVVIIEHTTVSGGFSVMTSFGGAGYRRIYGQPGDITGFTDTEWYQFGLDLIPPNSPVANFVTPDTVFAGAQFRLTNASLNFVSTLKWDIGNDGSTEYTTTNPNHSFPSVPTVNPHPIKLVATNPAGADSIVKTVVVVNPSTVPASDFVADRNLVSEFDIVQFTDMSSQGANSWNWSVSPGVNNSDYIISNANAQNPTVTFITRGNYQVCLTAGNVLGVGSTVCKSNYITVEEPLNNILCSQTSSTRTFGNIYDSGGPNSNYFPNLSCGFLIEPCGGTSVSLNFSEFNLGAGSTLRLYNGANASAPLIGSYTGTAGPLAPVIASSGKMYVFLQAAATVNLGFKANWTSVIAPPTPTVARLDLPDTGYMEIPFMAQNNSTGIGVSYYWYFDYPNNPFPAAFTSTNAPLSISYFGAANSIVPGMKYNVCLMARSCANDSMFCDSILIINPFRAPQIDFSSDRIRAFVGQDINFSQNVRYGASSYKWSFAPTTVTYQNATSSTSSNPTVRFSAPGLYSIQLAASNSFGSDSLEKYQYIEIVQYCVPTLGTPITDVGISRVQVGTINNSSTTGVTGYNNFLTQSTPLIFGNTYSITVDRATAYNNMGRKIWIDFNSDGDFADAGELVGSHTPDMSMSYTATFTVPKYNGDNAGTTRMRVTAAYNSSSFTSCSSLLIGEVEDYTVVLTRDLVAPTLTLLGADPMMVELNSVFADPGATATDNLQGNISSDIEVDNGVDMTQVGTYTIRYNVMDASGNSAPEITRTVIVVVDLTAPVVTLNGANPLHIPVNVPFADPGVTAIDNYNGNISTSVAVSGTVNTSVVGTYTLTYTAKDAFGSTTSVTRDVIVEDLVAPVITPVPGNTTFVQVLTPFIDPVTVTDNYDLNLSASTTGGPVNTAAPGTYVLTYNAVDNSGNAAIPYVLTVIVRDVIAPTLTVNSPDLIVVEVNTAFTLPTATYSDDFSSVTFVTVGAPNMKVLGDYPVVYRATDGSGNKSEKTITIRVVDTTKPILTVIGSNPTSLPRWQRYEEPNPPVAIIDNYNTPVQLYDSLIINNSVDATMTGQYFIWYKVKDFSGNWSDSVFRLVNVYEPLTGTGINELNFKGNFNIYPNPSNGLINYSIKMDQTEDVNLEIYNSVGQKVKSVSLKEINSSFGEINLTNVSPGIYFIKVISPSGSMIERISIN